MTTNIEIPARVVFLNIKDSNVFFDCSPAEARFAIEEIKRLRERKITLPELRDKVEKMNLLIISCKKKSKNFSSIDALTLTDLNKAFTEVESRDHRVDGVFISSKEYGDIRSWGKTVYDEATLGELDAGIWGHIWGADIIISNKIKSGTYYLVSLPEKRSSFQGVEFKDESFVMKFRIGKKMRF